MGTNGRQIVRVKVSKVSKNGRPAWLVDWRAEGRRRRRYFRAEAEAVRFLRAREEERKRLGAELEALPALERARLLEAWGMARAAGLDLREAVRVAVAARKAAGRAAGPAPTVAAAVAALGEAKEAAGARVRYLQQLRWTMRRFLLAFERRRVDEIGPEEIEGWLRRQTRWGAATRRSALTDVATLFNFCRRRGWIERNPAAGVERPRVEDKPPCILTPAEARRLLDTAAEAVPEVLGYLAIGLFAGLRPAELEGLRWAEVHPERGFVEVTAAKSKTRRRRLVRVEPVLAAWLRLAPREGVWVRPTNFVRLWRKLRRLAGVSWGHDIVRHSFASYHLARFRDAAATALELGHADQTMLFAHYREVVTPAAAAEWWGLMPGPA